MIPDSLKIIAQVAAHAPRTFPHKPALLTLIILAIARDLLICIMALE